MSAVSAVVGLLTGLALFALIVNYPDVPKAIAQGAAGVFAGVIKLAKPTAG